MCRKIYSKDRQYSSVLEFKRSAENVWYEIDSERMQNLVSSLETRTYDVIQKHGCTIKFTNLLLPSI